MLDVVILLAVMTVKVDAPSRKQILSTLGTITTAHQRVDVQANIYTACVL